MNSFLTKNQIVLRAASDIRIEPHIKYIYIAGATDYTASVRPANGGIEFSLARPIEAAMLATISSSEN